MCQEGHSKFELQGDTPGYARIPLGTLVFMSACDTNVRNNIPSQGSGSVFAARSSIENLMSWPFSRRDSGSAFMSQYCRPDENSVEVGLVPFG